MKDRLGSQEQQEPETAFMAVPLKVCLSPFLTIPETPTAWSLHF